MNNYLVLIRGGDPGFAKLNEEEQKALFAKWMTYVGKLNESGNWVSGNPLQDSGRLLCSKKEPQEGIIGDPEISVGGFMVLQAEDYDHALKLCDDCPTFDIGGKVEIRQAVEM
jgi:hypothetical protein